MPVVINELIITATASVKSKLADTVNSNTKARNAYALDKKEIIELCVEEVLQVLEKKGER